MVYDLLADFILLLHLAFIAFVVIGGLLVLKNVKWAWLHVPAAVWGGLVEFTGWLCPLTPLEIWLRFKAGAGIYHESFISHYLLPLIYPTELTRNLQILLGTSVVMINLIVYSLVLYKRTR